MFLRYRSNVFVRLVTPALLARYEYQPPRELSVVEPTRADILSQTACEGREEDGLRSSVLCLAGRKGEKCFMRSKGPMVFTAKVCVRWA